MSRKRIQHEIDFAIDVTPESTPTWEQIGSVTSANENMNEVVQQFQFFDKNGYGESVVTGMAPVNTLSIERDLNNAGQNYIASKKNKVGSERETNLRITMPTDSGQATVITVPVTMATIMEIDGDAVSVSSMSLTLHYNAEPTVVTGETIGYLSVTSIAGSSAGDTKINVNPVKEGSNIYKYQVAPNVTAPTINQDVSALNTWNGTDDITAATGQKILIIEATSANLAKKFGIQTVTSA